MNHTYYRGDPLGLYLPPRNFKHYAVRDDVEPDWSIIAA